MKQKIIVLLVCFCAVLGVQVASAQSRTGSGVVTFFEDGSPVIGATIVIKGTQTGVVADLDGKFSFSEIPSKATSFVISYIGYKTQEVAIGDNIKVVLRPDTEELEEVVVTAMGIKRSAKAIGYSATSVKGDDIATKRTTDMMSSLAGQVAGVSIASTSSDPGASTSVVIRGVSSLSGSNQPLYVIDGVPMNNSAVSASDVNDSNKNFNGLNSGFDFGNGASTVNPDDVASMTILKGAAATALYGSRAAAGVIIITTKTGKAQKGIGIEYNGGVQFSSVLRIPQMQNKFGMGWYGDKTDLENGSWGPRFDGSMQVWGNVYNNSQKMKAYSAYEDNVLDFFDLGVRYNNSLSFNGATENSDYFVSFSQNSDDGIIPTDADSYDKYTFSARGSHKVNNLTFSTSLNYALQKNSFATTGQGLSMYNSVMQTPRDVSIIGLADLNDPFNTPGYYYTPYGVTNPYYILKNYLNEYESERTYGKFQLDYDFLKYFKFTYRFGLDSSVGVQNIGEPNLYALYYRGTPNGEGLGSSSPFTGETGSYATSTTRRHEYNNDIMVNFSMPINDFTINAVAGFNGNERGMTYEYAGITDLTIPTWYNITNSATPATLISDESLRRLMGVYAQADVSWREMLFMTLTARNDWSSTLPKNNRSFFYPGVTGSFLFSEVLSDELKRVITFGKVRAAWGKTGNDADVYMINPVYTQSTVPGYRGDYAFPYSTAGYDAYTVGNTLGSSNLSPEMSTEYELGLNMALFNNRINIDAAYYNRETDKQIYKLNMDPASGYTFQNTNLGVVRNRGVELLVNLVPIKLKDFTWNIGWNFTKNNSKVLSLPEEIGDEALIYGLNGGIGMYAIVGKPVGTFKAEVAKRTENGEIVVNSSTGLPIAETEQQIIGDMNNDFQMGFTTGFKYKTISLNADFDFRKGGLMYSRTKDVMYFTGNAIQTAYNDRNPFVVPNSVVEVTDNAGNVSYAENTTALDNTNIFNYWDAGGTDMESAFLISKTYFKLRSVVLAWDLPQRWLKDTPFTNVRLSAYGNNLLMWTPSSNTFIDPEVTSFGNDLKGNFGEYSANPSSRRYGFNLMVKF